MYHEKFDEIYETFKVEIYKPVLTTRRWFS